MKRKIVILGSTGSIGTQALEVIEEHPDMFEVYVLTAHHQVDLLIRQARRWAGSHSTPTTKRVCAMAYCKLLNGTANTKTGGKRKKKRLKQPTQSKGNNHD